MNILKNETGYQNNLRLKLADIAKIDLRGVSTGDDGTFGVNFVIEFARARSKQVKSYLDNQLTTMKRNGAEASAINDSLATLAKYSAGFPDGNEVAWKDIKNSLQRAIDSLPPGSQTKALLQHVKDDPMRALNADGHGAGGSDAKTSKEDMASVQKELENALKDLDTQSQEAQLMINNKMSEFGQIFELAAKLLQAMNDSTKSILGRG
jgi:hypothetical protein